MDCRRKDTVMLIFVAMLLTFDQWPVVEGQNGGGCPTLGPGCSCAGNAQQPLVIRCSGAASLADVLSSLGAAKNTLGISLLVVENTPVKFLPPRVFQSFSLERLTLRKAGLLDVDPLAFAGPSQETLQELDLSDNNLTHVPVSGVGALRNLRKLNLAKNRLIYLQPETFVGFESKDRLRCLDLSGNKIGILDPDALAPLRQLDELNLEGNVLAEVPAKAIRHQASTLRHLNLGLNRISFVEPRTFDLPVLQSLSLEYNQLSDVVSETFYGLPSLLYLYLTGNPLTAWRSDAYSFLGKLRNLGIGNTGITKLPSDAFAALPSLLRLEMSNGIVNTVDPSAFRLCRSIQAIILNNNNLTEIDAQTFVGLTDLYSLDLSRNVICSIDDGGFSNLPSLRHLDLSGNQLQTLGTRTFERTFAPWSDAAVLYLCKNPWICDESLNWFRRWLRENMEMVVDKPDCVAVCRQPDWLSNWPLRFPNPPPAPDAWSSGRQLHQQQQQQQQSQQPQTMSGDRPAPTSFTDTRDTNDQTPPFWKVLLEKMRQKQLPIPSDSERLGFSGLSQHSINDMPNFVNVLLGNFDPSVRQLINNNNNNNNNNSDQIDQTS